MLLGLLHLREQFAVLSACFWGFPGGASSKEPTCQCRRHKRLGFDPYVGKIPWRRALQRTPVFLPGQSHRSAWWATVHRVAKNRTRLKWLSTHANVLLKCPCYYNFFHLEYFFHPFSPSCYPQKFNPWNTAPVQFLPCSLPYHPQCESSLCSRFLEPISAAHRALVLTLRVAQVSGPSPCIWQYFLLSTLVKGPVPGTEVETLSQVQAVRGVNGTKCYDNLGREEISVWLHSPEEESSWKMCLCWILKAD